MNKIVEIIKQLENTSSTNDKIIILNRNKDNELLKKILIYVYDKDKKFGIQKKSIVVRESGNSKWQGDLFAMLDELVESNINNDLKIQVGRFLGDIKSEDERDLVTRILLKDLRIGMKEKNVNKAIPGLIVTHDIMLGSKWDGKIKEEVAVMLKLDGIRSSWLIKDGKAICKSRQNKIIEGMNELTKEVERVFGRMDVFVDGEILAINKDNLDSKELFKVTSATVNSKGEKKGLTLVAFDIIPLEDYETKTTNLKFKNRRKLLEQLIDKAQSRLVDIAPLYFVTKDVDEVNEKLKEVVASGLEGLMISKIDGLYEFKRSKNLMKVKAMSTMDLRVIGFEEGDGMNKGTLGAVIVDFKGNQVRVGSGWTQEMRDEVWNNQDKYLNKLLEVQYFEITTNDKGEESLRFPVAKQWRFDKDDVSYE